MDKKAYRRYLSVAALADHSVHSVLRHLVGALHGRPDQHADHGASAGRRADPQRELELSGQVAAIDELATLVRAFNEMTEELEANSRELEARRRFTERFWKAFRRA